MTAATSFDPDGPGEEGALFGLPHTLDEARVRVLPVPFEATTSYRQGTAAAPDEVLSASAQVDLFDLDCGEAWRQGIALAGAPDGVADWDAAAVLAAERARDGDDAARAEVDAAGARVNDAVARWVGRQLDDGAIPALLGGDHAIALGGIVAAAERNPGLGVLQVDAHADLRDAYEGFRWSHASVMHNALEACPELVLCQVGIRDLGRAEHERIAGDPRVHTAFDGVLSEALAAGTPWGRLVDDLLAPLPPRVWISFDVDGLDPALCPATGTPVPGGLSWAQATSLIARVVRSGRTIVGFDLCEVGSEPWDAIVGARLLYKLACWSIVSQEPPGGSHVRP
jgi:agmatinase